LRLDTVWLIHRAASQAALRQARRSAELLRQQGARVCVAMSGPHANPFPGLLADQGAPPDLAVVLGGDGTVLGAARHLALNDFYLRPGLDEVAPTCELELEIDGEVVDQYRGDGLIISTATGSTGYSMAAGGPILHPGLEAIVVNPICPMSLSSRPVVVPPRAQLAVWPLGESSRRVRLWKDGAHATVLEPGDRCDVRRAPHHALMVQLEQSPSYYRTLSHKLHWAGSLTAAEPSPN